MMNKDNQLTQFKALVVKYKNLRKVYKLDFKEFNSIKLNVSNRDCKSYLLKFQRYYDDFSSLHYSFSKLDGNISYSEKTIVIDGEEKEFFYIVRELQNFSKINAEQIQFRCLYPLTLRSTYFSSRNAFRRDLFIFIFGIIFSCSFGFWLQNYYDKKNSTFFYNSFNKMNDDLIQFNKNQKKIIDSIGCEFDLHYRNQIKEFNYVKERQNILINTVEKQNGVLENFYNDSINKRQHPN